MVEDINKNLQQMKVWLLKPITVQQSLRKTQQYKLLNHQIQTKNGQKIIF